MKVLVTGGGGREHALVWKLSQSSQVTEIVCAPGNAGIEKLARCVPVDPRDIESLVALAREEAFDLTVVGPEDPLVKGMVDAFEAAGLAVFGPNMAAARLEGSKVFAKEFMRRHDIPTAHFWTFDRSGDAVTFIEKNLDACVVKADGLAAGKGVIVASEKGEALAAVEKIMVDRAFGHAGDRIVVEERLTGEEVSMLAFTDGETIVPMVSAQDHKAVHEGDKGPNTGGMGAYSPASVYTDSTHDFVMKNILRPAVDGLSAEGVRYKGVLYAGLMLTASGPQVLEFNVRFGDPETQPVLFRLDADLLEIMQSITEEKLSETSIRWRPEPTVCVVMASGGYPGHYEKGKAISGLDKDFGEDVFVFHAGTRADGDRVLTSGGRVLGVTARGPNLRQAIDRAYACVNEISFRDAFWRGDIGKKALLRLGL